MIVLRDDVPGRTVAVERWKGVLPEHGIHATIRAGSPSELRDNLVAYLRGDMPSLKPGDRVQVVRSGTTWAESQKLLAPDGAASDTFGSSVSVSGDIAAVAARSDDTLAGGVDAGSVHIFNSAVPVELEIFTVE